MEYAKLRDYNNGILVLQEFKNFYWRRYDLAENKFYKSMSNPMEAGWSKVWDFVTSEGKIISLTRDQIGQMLIEGATPESLNSGTIAVLGIPFKITVKGEGKETRYNIYLADMPQKAPLQSSGLSASGHGISPSSAPQEPASEYDMSQIPF